MYLSGVWRGFWQQAGFGRQSMDDFELRFAGGVIDGSGKDVIGRFVFRGQYDTDTGRVRMVKQYVGRHQVEYDGLPDGEGSIAGTWSIGGSWTGPFLIQPVHQMTADDAHIIEIK